jgi:glycine betaine/proline transport system permease protein
MDRLSDFYVLPLDKWIEFFVKDWLVPNFRPAFRAIEWPVDQLLIGLQAALLSIPPLAFEVVVALIAWRIAGRGVGVFTFIALAFLDILGIWDESMTTLAMVLTAVVFCAAVGVPLGIVAARSDRFAAFIRPILDIMQTIPAFVYLVPIVMLFGVGIVPGIIATIIFAMPPVIRLTNLGIRQVPEDVIAALIGAEGLGLIVYTGIGRLDVGAASLGGIGIVLIAIILDRITQALGEPSVNPRRNTLAQTLARLFGHAKRHDHADEAGGAATRHG